MKSLSESDICAKFITPALSKAGWSEAQIRREIAEQKRIVAMVAELSGRAAA